MDPAAIILLLAYGSLGAELLWFAVPSEASTYQLLAGGDGASDAAGAERLRRARRRPALVKVLRFALPTGLGIGLFLVPLVAVFAPRIIEFLLPIPGLQTPAARWTGAALVVLGRIATLGSMLHLRASQARGALQPAGPFAWSRNPGLLGMYAFYLGACLIWPCAVLFAGFVPYTLNMHQRVLLEESHLLASLGDTYRDYMARVPRYLLF